MLTTTWRMIRPEWNLGYENEIPVDDVGRTNEIYVNKSTYSLKTIDGVLLREWRQFMNDELEVDTRSKTFTGWWKNNISNDWGQRWLASQNVRYFTREKEYRDERDGPKGRSDGPQSNATDYVAVIFSEPRGFLATYFVLIKVDLF